MSKKRKKKKTARDKFVEEQKNIALQFRGSENQRIIDVRKALKDGNVVLRDFYQYRNSSFL